MYQLGHLQYNSIIPTYTSTNIVNPNEIVFECYGEKASYIHYQDNGLDFDYQKGQYNLYEVTFDSINLLHNGYTPYNKISNKIISYTRFYLISMVWVGMSIAKSLLSTPRL